MKGEKINGWGHLVYGCMGLGGDWSPAPYGLAEMDEAEAAVEAALDAGIGMFDQSEAYRFGKSEAVFGEIVVEETRRTLWCRKGRYVSTSSLPE